MAKRPVNKKALTFYEIVTRAPADVIRAALEARVQIDELLEERLVAYERICELETQVQTLVGDEGDFDFPAPPFEISGLSGKAGGRSVAGKAQKKSTAKTAPAAADVKSDPTPSMETDNSAQNQTTTPPADTAEK